MSKSKEITLNYFDYKIPITMADNYKETMETIKKTLYLQGKDLKRIEIYYVDEDEGAQNEY